jgi:hypothetical protein
MIPFDDAHRDCFPKEKSTRDSSFFPSPPKTEHGMTQDPSWAGMMSTLLASVLGWLLYPADCSFAAGSSLSVLIHGPAQALPPHHHEGCCASAKRSRHSERRLSCEAVMLRSYNGELRDLTSDWRAPAQYVGSSTINDVSGPGWCQKPHQPQFDNVPRSARSHAFVCALHAAASRPPWVRWTSLACVFARLSEISYSRRCLNFRTSSHQSAPAASRQDARERSLRAPARTEYRVCLCVRVGWRACVRARGWLGVRARGWFGVRSCVLVGGVLWGRRQASLKLARRGDCRSLG